MKEVYWPPLIFIEPPIGAHSSRHFQPGMSDPRAMMGGMDERQPGSMKRGLDLGVAASVSCQASARWSSRATAAVAPHADWGSFMHRYLRAVKVVLVVLATLAVAAPTAWAQGVTGSAVTGIITDETGKPVDGAEVQLINPNTGDLFTAKTSAGGRY